MAHNVENMVYVGETPWHGLGEKVSEIRDLPDCLNWEVELKDLFFMNGDYNLVQNFRAMVRSSDHSVLGIASDYTPHQNKETWELFKRFADHGDMRLDTAGSLREGKIIWALAEIDRHFIVGESDRTNLYALLSTSHDGKMASIVKGVSTRVVCNNTLDVALGENSRTHRQTHKAGFNVDAASDFVKEAILGFDLLAEKMQQLKQVKIDREVSEIYVAELLAPKVLEKAIELSTGLKYSEDNRQTWLSEVMEKESSKTLVSSWLHENAPLPVRKSGESRRIEADGTLYGELQGITRYVDHNRGRTQDTRLTNAWFGSGKELKDNALDYAVDYARIMA